jgi:7-keto-8-aminopelargonate synthetase-like enzyme
MRASGATRKIFRHNDDVDHLEQLLAESDPGWPRIVVIESAYSMDADTAPIPGICRFLLYHCAILMQDLFRQRRIPMASTESHIVPARVDDPHKCKQLADVLLYGHAQYAQPIDFPSVPRGTERLRITPSPLHSPSATRRFVEHIDMAWTEFALRRAPDFAFDSRSPFATDAVGRAVSG